MPATTTQFNVTTSPVLIAPANTARQELIITNAGVTPDAFLGTSSSMTTTTGLPLFSGQTRERSRGFSIHLGDVWCVTASGTADIRVWETTR